MQTIYKNFTRDLNRPEAIILCCSTGTGGLSDQVMKGTAIEASFFLKKIFLERWGFWLRADCQGTSVPSYLCKKPTGTPVSFSSRSSNNPLWACLISDGDLHQITENWGHGAYSSHYSSNREFGTSTAYSSIEPVQIRYFEEEKKTCYQDKPEHHTGRIFSITFRCKN